MQGAGAEHLGAGQNMLWGVTEGPKEGKGSGREVWGGGSVGKWGCGDERGRLLVSERWTSAALLLSFTPISTRFPGGGLCCVHVEVQVPAAGVRPRVTGRASAASNSSHVSVVTEDQAGPAGEPVRGWGGRYACAQSETTRGSRPTAETVGRLRPICTCVCPCAGGSWGEPGPAAGWTVCPHPAPGGVRGAGGTQS